MATNTGTFSMLATNQAAMRLLVQFYETLATNAGLVQTGDTGQTSGASFPAGSGTNTSAGYQIWRFADSLQATKPVYFKIEWGTGASSNSLGLWVTIGTGSNGTGTITGIIFARQAIATVGAGAAGPYRCVGSASTNRLSMIYGMSYATQNSCILFGFERSKDASGNDTGDGVMWVSTAASGSAWVSQYVPFVGTARAAQVNLDVPVPGGTTSLAYGNVVGFVPILPFGVSGAVNPGLNFLLYQNTDTPFNDVLSVTFFGASHVYFKLGIPQGWGAAATLVWATSTIAMRYE